MVSCRFRVTFRAKFVIPGPWLIGCSDTPSLAKHPKGCIKKEDFGSIVKEYFPTIKNAEKLQSRLFNMYDTNKDGTISFREFMMAMYVMCNGTVEEKFRQIFRL